ncbi:MAG: hypothetical protein WDM96_01840 [Lacunisphaera sp.]
MLQPLPFADDSLDLVQSIFAPRPWSEIKRVLRPGGYALIVHPQAGHWQELRTFLPLAKIGDEKLPASDLAGFAPVALAAVTEKRELSHALLADLVEMSSLHPSSDARWDVLARPSARHPQRNPFSARGALPSRIVTPRSPRGAISVQHR